VPIPEPLERSSAYLLTQADLDRLPTIRIEPRGTGLPVVECGHGDPSDGYLPDAETWTPDGVDDDELPPPEVLALMRCDRILGNERSLSEHGTGRLRGVVLDALRAWHRGREVQLSDAEAHEAQVEALRAEVARLSGLLDEEVGRRARAELDLEACRAQQLRQARTITEQRSAGDLDGDPRRPHLDSWPDDAVLLRYRELRHLVALHLDRYCDPRSAAAMREGDVPLRLAEVLDR
jgi:hypothetical protein